MELTYTTAGKQDIEILYRLSKNLIDTYEDISSIDYEKVLLWVHRKVANNISEYTRVCRKGQVAGYYRLTPCDNGLELDDLYILPQFRGQGIGSQVLHRCCASGIPLMLYVFSGNTRAIALYERFGFQITEIVGPTRCIMRRPAVPSQEVL